MLSTAVADAVLQAEMHDQPCWQVTRVLGSMLAFDFGGREFVLGRKGMKIAVGTSTLSVRNCRWSASGPGVSGIDSDNLDARGMERLREAFVGARLEGCSRRDRKVILRFGQGLRLRLDVTNAYEVPSDEEIMELNTKGGLSMRLSPLGRFSLGDQGHQRAVARAAA